MTGRLKIISVADIDYYLERAGGPMNYYLGPADDGHEPPGVWVGSGARALGLTGLIDPQVMKKLYEQRITPDGKQIGRKPSVYLGNAGRADELTAKINRLIEEERKAKGPFLTQERIDEIERKERAKVRNSVLAWDFTWSVSKSISLTHAGLLAQVSQAKAAGDEAAAAEYQRQANLIIDAIRDTAAAIITRFEATACFTRTGGHHGAGGDGAYRDAAGVIGASFLQHTNRNNDPHLHVHTVVANLVQRADGVDETYRTLDGKPLLRARSQLDAVAKRMLAARLNKLGIPLVQRSETDGFEVGGVTGEQITAYSSRKINVEQGVWVHDGKRRGGCGCPCERGEFCGGCGHGRCHWHLEPGMAGLVEEYERVHGRPPSRAKVWQLHEQAFRSGRKPKSKELTSSAELLALWERKADEHQVASLGSIPAAVALFAERHPASLGAGVPSTLGASELAALEADSGAVLRADGSVLGEAERHTAIRIAVAEVQRQNASWFASDLMWEIQAALPPLHRDADSAALMELCLTEAISNEVEGVQIAWLGEPPDITDTSVLGLRASDGKSVYRKPQTDKYCTLDHLDTEEYLLHAAGRKVRPKMTSDEAFALLESRGLSEEQLSAAAELLSTARPTVVFVGPAGTGKSYTLGVMSQAYIEATGHRVIGLALAKNAVRVLQDEGIAEAYTIADFLGQLKDGGRRGHIEVGAGDIIIIDESSQVPTDALAELQSIASEAGTWIIQAGDTEQLPSPEAGGMMRLIATEHGYVQIREVRRFREPWEGSASLRLRDGDLSVIEDYKQHGRIYGGRRDDMNARAVRHWLGDHLAGMDTLLLAGSNEEAAELADLARRELIRLGEVRNSGDVRLAQDGNDASVGDMLRARQNSKIPAAGKPLENRDVIRLESWWTAGLHRQAIARRQLPGGRWSEPFPVPEDYIAQHTELAYAGNVDVAEGKTVDTAHSLITPTMNRARFLVALTRGRRGNTAYTVTAEAAGRSIGGDRPAPELIREAHDPEITPESVLESIITREPGEITATEVLRESRAFPTSMPHLHKLWQMVTRESTFPGYDRALQARLRPDEYARYLKEDQRSVLHHQLRRAELAGADVTSVLDQVTSAPLTGADSIASVLHGRVERLRLPRFGTADSYTARTPVIHSPDHARIARVTAEAMDAKQLELGAEVARKPPVWAVRYLGMPPREPGALREDWIRRAGAAAGFRELAAREDPVEAIGELPPAGAAELREAWAAAARALEMPEEETDVRMASQGQLESVVQAYERIVAWAPEYVADRLEETSKTAQMARANARIAEAKARDTGLPRDEQRAARAHAQAEAADAERELLAEIHTARTEWAQHTEPTRARANEAAGELTRREQAKEKVKVKVKVKPAPSGQGPDAQAEPETIPRPKLERERERSERSDAELADLARLAQERIRMEREQAEADPWEREPWRDQYEAEQTATWQPGRVDPEPDPQLEPEAWD